MVEECNFYVLVRWKKKKRKKIAILILILVPVKFPNVDFDPWTFLSFHQKNANITHESNIASPTYYVMGFFS
jgi:hypothetical protein